MALFGIDRAKRSVDVAVDRTTQDLNTVALARRVDGLQSELNGVKSGLEIGMGRLRESCAEVNKNLVRWKPRSPSLSIVKSVRHGQRAGALPRSRTKMRSLRDEHRASDAFYYVTPSPEKVVLIVDRYGLHAAEERWGRLNPRQFTELSPR